MGGPAAGPRRGAPGADDAWRRRRAGRRWSTGVAGVAGRGSWPRLVAGGWWPACWWRPREGVHRQPPGAHVTGLTVAAARQRLDAVHFSWPSRQPPDSTTVAGGRGHRPAAPAHGGGEGGHHGDRGAVAGLPFVPVAPPDRPGLRRGRQRVLSVAGPPGQCPAAGGLQHHGAGRPGHQLVVRRQAQPTTAPYGSTVLVAVSKGKPPVPVPTVPPAHLRHRPERPGGLGLQADPGRRARPTVPTGQVVWTTPAAGAVAQRAATVEVTVSTGPPMVAVPTARRATR